MGRRRPKRRRRKKVLLDRLELFLIIMSSLQVFGVRLTVGGSYGVKGRIGERGGEGRRQRGEERVFILCHRRKKKRL